MKVIGIVGGVGPYAGLEFNKLIFDATPSKIDQNHLEVVLISASSKIEDRTQYILNQSTVSNPAEAIFSVILNLHKVGADLIAIPCNTAHSPPIMDVVIDKINRAGIKVKLVNMLEETFKYLKIDLSDIQRIGLLATRGTYQSEVYQTISDRFGIELLIPDKEKINQVHTSIYDQEFGIKAKSNPVLPKAITILKSNAEELISRGAQGIIMGCTEIPLALSGVKVPFPLLDPMDITAKVLVKLAQSS